MSKRNIEFLKKRDLAIFLSFLAIIWSYLVKKCQKNALIGVFLIFSIHPVLAQESISRNVENDLQTIIEDFIEFNEGNADFDFNTIYEDLLILSQNKINLNDADAKTLGQLIFLSSTDIQNIISYRSTFGDFISPYELQSVPGLDIDKINSLLLFVEIKETRRTQQEYEIRELNPSRNKLFLKWKYNIETPLGFLSEDGRPSAYIGNKNHWYLRYNRSGLRHRMGLIIEKDPGEKMFNEISETRIDYLSFHYQINQLNSWIDQLNLGDFSVSLGQGLIAHNAFGIGKSSLVTQVKKGNPGIRSYNSVAENLALRGAAITLNPRTSPFQLIAFVSYAPRDVNLTGVDTTGIETFSSFPSSGLHRTDGERLDQDGTYETAIGGSIGLKTQNIKVSMNALHQTYDKTLVLNRQPYQIYRWEGTNLSNYSVDYNFLAEGWNVFGEAARSSSGGWANLHGVIKTLDPKFDLSAVYRNFQPEYQNIYGNSFGESNNVNNERGVYVGFEYRPDRHWTLRGFVDQWSNDWLRFRTDGLSRGREYLLRLIFRQKRKRNIYLQYRYERKFENSSEDLNVDFAVPRTIQRLRAHASHHISERIELRSRLEFSLYKKSEDSERGMLIYQDIISRSINSPLILRARVSYFNISDFDSRIYTYENDLLYEYYIPSFSGEGLRYYVHLRYNLSNHLMAEMRWEQTNFFDKEVISSGNNQINGNTTSRIKVQIRYSF